CSHDFPRAKAIEDLDELLVVKSGANLARLESQLVFGPYKNDGRGTIPLEGVAWHGDGVGPLARQDAPRSKGPCPQLTFDVVHFSADADRPRPLIDFTADPRHGSACFDVRQAVRLEQNALALLHPRHVLLADF